MTGQQLPNITEKLDFSKNYLLYYDNFTEDANKESQDLKQNLKKLTEANFHKTYILKKSSVASNISVLAKTL